MHDATAPTPAALSPEVAEARDAIAAHSRAIKGRLYRPARGQLRRPYLSAGIASYPNLVDWDAVWAGASYCIDGDARPLWDSVLNLLDHVRPGGLGQRVVKPDGYGVPGFQIRPFLASGVFVAVRDGGAGASPLTPDLLLRLHEHLEYWHRERTGRQGLLKWWNVNEGFADNGLANWAWEPLSVEGVDLNAQMVLEHTAAAYVFERAGRDDWAGHHRDRASALAARLDAALWHEEDGCYYSSFNPTDLLKPPVPIRVHGYTNLWPLWLGLTSADRAKRLIERYVLAPEHYWSPWGVRSLSASDLAYNNARRHITTAFPTPQQSGPAVAIRCSNWQGPVWVVTNYLAALALSRYGYATEARTVADRTVLLLAKAVRELGSFQENYHAETGEGLCAPEMGSWCVMMHHLHDHLDADRSVFLRGLDLPRPGVREGNS